MQPEDDTPSGLHHIGIWPADLQKSIRFYTEGLGYVVDFEWTGSEPSFGAAAVMLRARDGSFLELFSRRADPARWSSDKGQAPGPLLHLAMRVSDCEASLARALEAGGRPLRAPVSVLMKGHNAPDRKARIAFVNGPDGEAIEFFESDAF